MFGKMILDNGNEYNMDVMEIARTGCNSRWDSSDEITISGTLYKITTQKSRKLYKKIIFNYPATIVIWNDGTKTVVKCQEGESYDKEKGVSLCFMKKFLGNKTNFNNIFRDCGALNEGVKNE
jgi:hypothetical protein